MRPYPASSSSTTAYTSTRLQVDNSMPSLTPEYPQSLVSASPRRLSGTASFSRISTGAVLWLSPTTTICILRHRPEALNSHPNQSKNHTGKSNDRQIGGAFGPPSNGQATDQNDKIEEPGDQRPRLFEIPIHVAALGKFGRDGAGDDSQREKRKAQDDRLLVQVIEKIQGRQLRIQHIESL